MADPFHVYWLAPMPGVAEPGRVVVADTPESLTIMLPDNSQIIVTADRVAIVRHGHMMTLAQWQMTELLPPDAALEAVPDEPLRSLPPAGDQAGTYTLHGRRTYGGSAGA